MLTFFSSLWISLIICFLSSFVVLFAKNMRVFTAGCICFLSGIIFSLIQTDFFAGITDGRFAVCAIIAIFTFEWLTYHFIQNQKNPVFYALPFLAFISLAISTNLIMILCGFMLFDLAFILLAKQRNLPKIMECFFKTNIGLLAFSYGASIIFSRIGSFKLSDIKMELSINTNDEWLMFGFGLLLLSAAIQLYSILLLIKKERS